MTEALTLRSEDAPSGFPLLPTLDSPDWTGIADVIISDMVNDGYDLWYDATSVGADLVAETWISHSPRASDTAFDPLPGDWVTAGDDEEPSIRGRITRRDANKVWVQLQLGLDATDVASRAVGLADTRFLT